MTPSPSCFRALRISFAALTLTLLHPAPAEPLLTPGDPVVPFDEDSGSASSYPGGESPANGIDGDPNTKYLNFGRLNSGFIVTPASGSSVVKSLQMTTANDSPERDPVDIELFGTNDAIISADNTSGDLESWVSIGFATLALPIDRFATAPAINFANDTSYTSYRWVARSLKGPGENSMQFADIQFFTEEDAAGTALLAVGDPILAVHLGSSQSNSPAVEDAPFVIDGLASTKYLNFGKENSGLIVTPSKGVSVVKGFTMTTANDAPERDPADWEILGSNEPIVSVAHGTGKAEAWTSIATGTVTLPDVRNTEAPAVAFDNSVAYTSYKFVFRSLKDGIAANSMQLAELQLDGELGNGTPLEITEIDYDGAGNQFTVTWRSEQDGNYALYYSPDLIDWGIDLEDSISSGGDSTSYGPFPNPGLGLDPVPDRGFFRVERNPPAP